MNKKTRQKIYNKYDGHCAYCGNVVIPETQQKESMYVDHLIPQIRTDIPKEIMDGIDNLMPACWRCNHYKRSYSLEDYRDLLKTLGERIRKRYINKVAIDYGIININSFDGIFYFEAREGMKGRKTCCRCGIGEKEIDTINKGGI